AIEAEFGEEQRFYTCGAQDLTADGLIEFLEVRNKFGPMPVAMYSFGGKACDGGCHK
ncbi:putative metal-binding protein, partial [Kipferlia bialata]